ncbi:MAG: prolyl oligopeptidase family serine peptidase [Proteobacteria bacterium]|nr:prolyl oligopeptidase family serine peptidase [Pseudomonadota bacterium]
MTTGSYPKKMQPRQEMEKQFAAILEQQPLPPLPNDVVNKLWESYRLFYNNEAVPLALTFFTQYMPPFKVNKIFEEMIINTFEKSFDKIYAEPGLKTLYKILGSDINVEIRKKYLTKLIEQPNIFTKLQVSNIMGACIMAWGNTRNASKGISKAELLFALLQTTPKPAWMTTQVENFLKDQEQALINTLDKDIKQLENELPYHFESRLEKMLIKNRYSAYVKSLLHDLGKLANSDALSYDKRFDIFKRVLFYSDNANSLAYNHIVEFILKNWQSSKLQSLFKTKSSPVLKLNNMELTPFLVDDKLLSLSQSLEHQKAQMPLALANVIKNIQDKLKVVELHKNKNNDPDVIEEKLNNALAYLHEENLENYTKMIFSDEMEEEPIAKTQPLNIKEIIYNQQGYDEGFSYSTNPPYKVGKALNLADSTPIGYNIYLPKGLAKAVLVEVYGGNRKEDRKEKAFAPGVLTDLHKALLNKDIAVITLNLPDLLESHYQFELPKDLEEKLQASINHLFQTLKFHPDQIDAELKLPSNIPFCLFGASFGGRTAIKQVEKYPDTWDRVISFDGAISIEMLRNSNMPIVGSRGNSPLAINAQAYLDPVHDIDKITADVLLLHNMDDNNVNLKVTLDWYKRAKKLGMENQVKLHITDKGNPVDQKLYNTGHYLPAGQISLNNVIDAMTEHIFYGCDKKSILHDWRALRYKILANKNYKLASVEEKYISLAYREYKEKGENVFKEKSAPMYYTINYLATVPTDIQSREIKMLNNHNLLTQAAITAGLEFYLLQFLQFLKEKDKIPLPKQIRITELVKNQELRDQYRDTLLGGPKGNPNNFNFALSTFYQANPQLLKTYIDKCNNDPIIQHNLKRAENKLKSKLVKEEKIISQFVSLAADKLLATAKAKRMALIWKEQATKSPLSSSEAVEISNQENQSIIKPPK